MIRYLLAMALAVFITPTFAQPAPGEQALQHSVEQLRLSIGRWSVVTEFLNEDGTVARSVTGSYEFSWVVPDRVVTGRNDIPELQQASGILFYINEKKSQIEMAAVGADGMLWIMTGDLGGEVRTTQEFKTADGGSGQLRFTRYNVSENSFESRMEYTEDGGETWKPGNHQQFSRVPSPDQSM
jgi:hypothetical protein